MKFAKETSIKQLSTELEDACVRVDTSPSLMNAFNVKTIKSSIKIV